MTDDRIADPLGPDFDESEVAPPVPPRRTAAEHIPVWAMKAIALFWFGYLVVSVVTQMWNRLAGLVMLLLITMFLAFALEPAVNRLVARGWKRGRATALLLFGLLAVALAFVGAIGTVIGTQIADLLQNSDRYIQDAVDRINDLFGSSLEAQDVIDEFKRPDGPVQRFIDSQQDKVVRLSITALGVIVQTLSVLLFTFYAVADGPRFRRAICSRLRPERQRQVLDTWELAISKTGGYLYSRALLALLSAFFHWVIFQVLGVQAPIPLALWVGLISQFLPVLGTYVAGIVPVLITFLDSPVKAAIVLAFVIVYQQVENLVFTPRITARTMQIHPAVAFGAALAGFALLGGIGAILALPAAAMIQALASEWGERHEVIESALVDVPLPDGRDTR